MLEHLANKFKLSHYLLYTSRQRQAPHWRGRTLMVPSRLPETVLAAISGCRLGDLVEGSGRDDAVIRNAVETVDGWTDIVVEDVKVDLKAMTASGMIVATGPVRRLIWRGLAAWLRTFVMKDRTRRLSINDVAFGGAVAAAFALMLYVMATIMTVLEHDAMKSPDRGSLPPVILMASIILPMMAYLGAGFTTAFVIDLKHFLRTRGAA